MNNITRIVCVLTVISSLFVFSSCSDAMEEETSTQSIIETTESTFVTTVCTTTTVSTTTTESTTNKENTLHIKYKDALLDLYNNLQWPTTYYPEGDDRVPETIDGFNISDNEFAIVDVDSDGVDELIIDWHTTSVLGWHCEILEYDPITNNWKSEGLVSPYDTIFYNNGIVFVPARHNQSFGNAVWPYSIYKYNPTSDSYCDNDHGDGIGSIACFDTEYFSARNMSIPIWFTEADTDNAGVVYIIYFDGYDPQSYYSQSEYDSFLESIIGDANIINIDYLPLTIDNINNIV